MAITLALIVPLRRELCRTDIGAQTLTNIHQSLIKQKLHLKKKRPTLMTPMEAQFKNVCFEIIK